MNSFKNLLLILLLASPIWGFAQKAYEQVFYTGLVNGMNIKFTYADGYLMASQLELKAKGKRIQTFIYDNFNENTSELKLLNYLRLGKSTQKYIVLTNIRERDAKLPNQFLGKYYSGKKQYAFILKKR